jgi:hypothetical protein
MLALMFDPSFNDLSIMNHYEGKEKATTTTCQCMILKL